MTQQQLTAAVVGCRMGGGHAKILSGLSDYRLVGVCDLVEATARAISEQTGGTPVYTDYAKMLSDTRPDLIVVATPTGSHCALTLQAAQAGVKAVYCEKPMAINLGEAHAMLDACRAQGVKLVVGHQRRMSAPYRTMRRLIDEGALGDVYLIRGSCAGDFLSDGTHTADSILYLNGDRDVKWLIGQIFRDKPQPYDPAHPYKYTGTRYGHNVETGAMTTFEFDNGVRAEILTGDLRFPGRNYQDIEVFGSKGRLWRAGDPADPALQIWDEQTGGWREQPLDGTDGEVLKDVFRHFALTIREDTPHPMNGEVGLKSLEIVMGVYESARLNAKLELPFRQDRFPLDVMLEAGRFPG